MDYTGPETQCLVKSAAELAEEAPLDLGTDGREMTTSSAAKHRRVVLFAGVAIAAVAVLSLAAVHGGDYPEEAQMGEMQGKVETKIEAFQQCGGQKWKNGTCCQKGCACIAETRYYSQCKAPEGLQSCNWNRAKIEYKGASERVAETQADLEGRQDTVKALQKSLKIATEKLKEAEKEADKAEKEAEKEKKKLHEVEAEAGVDKKKADHETKTELDKAKKEAGDVLAEKTKEARKIRDDKLKKAKDAHDDALDAKTKAKKTWVDADELAAKKTKERAIVKGHVDKFDKEDKIRKEKKDCGGIFAQCTKNNCCAIGCEPHWQNKYFCQCEGPGGAKYCAWKELVKKYNESTDAMPILTQQWKDLLKANETAAKNSKKADDNFDEVAAKSKKETDAALEEFKVSAKKPAAVHKEKVDAAIAKAHKLWDAAKAKFDEATKKAREKFEVAERKAKEKADVEEEKRRAEAGCAREASNAAKAVTQAKMALASAKSAVGSWKRASKGDPCGTEGDTEALGF